MPPFAPTRFALEAPLLGLALEQLRHRTGANLAGYRRATLERRIANRMIAVGATSLRDYVDRLGACAEEPRLLLARVTIKVSRFYRNPACFDHLRAEVLPRLARAARGRPLRLWSAGCAHGEEAYTLAMLCLEAGVEAAIDATDVDGAALAEARLARFGAESCRELPAALAGRFLDEHDGWLRPVVAVREMVHFARHDLAGDAPPPAAPYDLVCCRNVLIYFERERQERMQQRLLAALARPGWLCLGEAEWPGAGIDPQLDASDARARVFRTAGGAAP